MGKLKVIKIGVMTTIQDKGRFGCRQFGIPQSGAMDLQSMQKANYLVGNPKENPVVEFALTGMKLEALEDTIIGVSGAEIRFDQLIFVNATKQLLKGDIIEILNPKKVYAYLSIGGVLKGQQDFGSYSTYTIAAFGGMDGRALRVGDILETENEPPFESREIIVEEDVEKIVNIRIEKGPEWSLLQELPTNKVFTIDPASNRMGIRLSGSTLKCDGSEIISSAVIPGTIQLPSNGQPIVLMNDCQTTGGYPRIGKVLEEDIGKLAQVKAFEKIQFHLVSSKFL